MSGGTTEATLLDSPPPQPEGVALVPAQPAADLVTVIERLASNPNVDVDKLERIIALQKDILRTNAKAAFDAAFSQMQNELPEIDERGQIIVKGVLRSTYSKLEDIQKATKPILKKYEFAIRHRTEWPAEKPGIIRIVGILSHAQGHSEESVFEAAADKSDYRTDIQSMGSTVSYGRRYTTIDLLNITTRGVDDDGQKSGRPAPPRQEEYEKWFLHLEQVATRGSKAFEPAWEASDADFKTYAANHDRERLKAVKAIALGRGRA